MSRLQYDAGRPKRTGVDKIFIATPVYQSPDSAFHISPARSALKAAGFDSAYLELQGNCHVDDARNEIVARFLESDCDALVFIDGDVVYTGSDLVRLCSHHKPIVGGVYPYRKEGAEEMPVRMRADVIWTGERLLPVAGLPTGFLYIKREVFEVVSSWCKQARHPGTKEWMTIFFERDIFEESRRGGDIRFTMLCAKAGYELYADTSLRLGHVARIVVTDSLGAMLRRLHQETISHICWRLREGEAELSDFQELWSLTKNHFAMPPKTLKALSMVAMKARGPILEIGSGLSTIAIAASTEMEVWTVESDPVHAEQLRVWARQGELTNIRLVTAPLRDGWYAISPSDRSQMPANFDLALVDGPARLYGDRIRFFGQFGNVCKTILVDDTDDAKYLEQVSAWADYQGRRVIDGGRVSIIAGKVSEMKEAAE